MLMALNFWQMHACNPETHRHARVKEERVPLEQLVARLREVGVHIFIYTCIHTFIHIYIYLYKCT